MKVRLRNIEVDCEKEPVKLIFEDDDHLKTTINNLSNMTPSDGPRSYTMFPSEMSVEEINKSLEVKSEDLLFKDKWVRSLAEFENFKKRSNKEKEDIRNSTKVSMISAILDLDNDLSIALNQIKDVESRRGMELMSSKLESFLKSQNIESIQTDKYDPDIHEVISILHPGGEEIIDVVSKGYMIGKKPFKFPKVILGKAIMNPTKPNPPGTQIITEKLF